jgi:hypothetical protein
MTHKPAALQAPRMLIGDKVKVRRHAGGVYEVEEKRMASEAVQHHKRQSHRKCSCGCGQPLFGKWPYIKGHNKSGAAGYATGLDDGPPKSIRRGRPPKSAQPAAKGAHKANGRGNGHALAGGAGNGVVALRVNESQLNDFILRLPIEQRAAMVNAWLAGAE